MSTELRNVPDCNAQYELTQTRFWGGKNQMTCLQVTQRKPKNVYFLEEENVRSGYDTDDGGSMFNWLQLTRHQARMLSVELMLFAEGRDVEAEEIIPMPFAEDDEVDADGRAWGN